MVVLYSPQLKELIKICVCVFGAIAFLWISCESVMPAEALQVCTADSTSELELSAVTQFSSDQEMPNVVLSKNLLFRGTSRGLTAGNRRWMLFLMFLESLWQFSYG